MRRARAFGLVLVLAAQFTLAHAAADTQTTGTTIIGEREAAVGLYLTPWREERASDIDRPPRLFDPARHPLDAAGFEREVEVRESIEAYRRARVLRR